MSLKHFSIILLIFLISQISSKTKNEWKSRSIYFMLTDRFARTDGSTEKCKDFKKYCGGTFKGLTNNLDYIKNMGFNAIWITPVVENYPDSYHGYHMINLYKIEPHLGTEEDLKKLIKECHKRDIWVMLDIVMNHVGPVGKDYSKIVPFNKSEHYHSESCIIKDFNNETETEKCRLADLPDLNHENKFVTQTLLKWAGDLVKKYKFDGYRLDTVLEVPKSFWKLFAPIMKAAKIFTIGEAFNDNIDRVASYQELLDSVLNYPYYYAIKSSFEKRNFRNLENYHKNLEKKFKDVTVLGNFIENHDNRRFLYGNGNHKYFKNAVTLTIFWTGIPIFYYGGEHFYGGGDDPANREPLWTNMNMDEDWRKEIKLMNNLRYEKKIWKLKQLQNYCDEHFYAFSRGDEILVCAFIGDGKKTYDISYHEFKVGDKLCNLFNKNECVTVDSNKIIKVEMNGDPKVYVKNLK